MCGGCVGQIVYAIRKCGLDFFCLIPKSGICASCLCNVVAMLAVPFLTPICQGLSGPINFG